MWKNDKFEGKGTCIESDGVKYVGEWTKNQMDGKGILTFPDGKKIHGVWKYDLQKRKYTQLPHLSKIYVPPAYTDVRMSCNPESKVLAYGFDSKGRKQYVYNKQFIEEQNELKADALEKATRDARTKADALAAGMGLKVYRVISISDSSWDYGVHRMAYAEIEEASAVAGGVHADTQILAGDVEVSARVYAEFELA